MHLSKNTKALIQKDVCTPVLTTALFTAAKIWKQPNCPSMDEWIKMLQTHTQWNINIIQS